MGQLHRPKEEPLNQSLSVNMKIRRYKIGEEETLWRLCRDTNLEVIVKDYSKELVQKWVSSQTDMKKWEDRIRRKNPFVAEQDGNLVGFAELTTEGRISAFYCHYKWQGKGVGSALLAAIEDEATQLEIDTIQVDSSTSAKGSS